MGAFQNPEGVATTEHLRAVDLQAAGTLFPGLRLLSCWSLKWAAIKDIVTHTTKTLFAQVKRFLADAGAEAHPYKLKLCNCDWQTIILNFIAMFVNFVFKVSISFLGSCTMTLFLML